MPDNQLHATEFMGHSYTFWSTLLDKAECDGVVGLIEEIADLRAKVSFYESRVLDMAKFMEIINAR